MNAQWWNDRYPIGTAVDVLLDSGETYRTRTRDVAWDLDSGHTLVPLENIAGGYRLERVTPVDAAPTTPPRERRWFRVMVARDMGMNRREGRSWDFEAVDEWEAYEFFDNARKSGVKNLKDFQLVSVALLDSKTRQPVTTHSAKHFGKPTASAVRKAIKEGR